MINKDSLRKNSNKIVLVLGSIFLLLLIFLMVLQKVEENKKFRKQVEESRINLLISCVEKEHLETLLEFDKICDLSGEEDCFMENLLAASYEHDYNDRKTECIKSYLNK